MKFPITSLMISMICMVAASVSLAQLQRRDGAQNVGPGPQEWAWARQMFREFKHDFGTVVRNEEAEHRFEIENVYEEDMRIESVTSSCGCTKVSVTKNVLKTWEKAEIIAKLDTQGTYAGARTARITVQFARPYFAQVYLDIKGNIRTDTSISPGSINFGSFCDPEKCQQSVTMTRYGNPQWRIKDIVSTFKGISVALNETERNANRVSYQLNVSLKDNAEMGRLQTELIVIAQDRPNDEASELRFPIPVMGNFTSELRVTPEILNIVNIKEGEEVRKKVLLAADQPFRIEDVMCDNDAFRVLADQDEKKVHSVEVIYVGEAAGTSCETKLQFKTNLASANMAELTAMVAVDP